MKKLRRISRRYYLRQIVACWMVYSLMFFIPVRVAMAAPQGGQFIVGGGAPGAVINDGIQHSTVQVGQMESIIHWDSLNTASDETLSFGQMAGLSEAAVLNRVVGEGATSMTQFNGALNAADGMRIFMINPAGICFGKTAVINVTQLVASSLDIEDGDFLNGLPYTFFTDPELGAGVVKFEGTTTERLDVMGLIGREVINKGALVANDLVVLAAGDSVMISETGGTVLVKPSMGGGVPSDFIVNNDSGGEGIIVGEDSDSEESRIILAAGDVWSSALVKAYSDGGSDAVATVDIIAEGDVTITDKVGAKADGYGDGSNNAIASVYVEAGGNVEISDAQGREAKLYAEAFEGANNTATVTVNAGEDVSVSSSNYNEVRIYAMTGTIKAEGATNKSTVTVNAEGDVRVQASGNYDDEGYAAIEAEVFDYAGEGTDIAQTTVNAGHDVVARAENGGEVDIDTETWYGATNQSTTTINAGDNVIVKATGEDSDASVEAEAWYGGQNMANTDILANNVLVLACNGGYSEITAFTKAGQYEAPIFDLLKIDVPNYEMVDSKNQANVNIETYTVAVDEEEPPVPGVGIQQLELQSDGIGEAFVDMLEAGGHVAVAAIGGSQAKITAEAYGETGTNDSDLLICAEGAVIAAGIACEQGDDTSTGAEIMARSGEGTINEATLGIGAQLGFAGIAYGYGSEAQIYSEAMYGTQNTAETVVCTGGPLGVLAVNGGNSAIYSEATGGQTSSAYTGVCADSLVAVAALGQGSDAVIDSSAQGGEYGTITSLADDVEYEPPTATAETVVVSNNSGVVVAAVDGAIAEIGSSASGAYYNDAYTGVCAEDHIIVAAGADVGDFINGGETLKSVDGGSGGEAYIYSEAGGYYGSIDVRPAVAVGIEQVPVYGDSTSNAETAVVSHKGSVVVADYTGEDEGSVGSAGISSEAYGSELNTAYTGVAAGADLSPGSADLVEPSEPENVIDYLEQLYRYDLALETGLSRGDVVVYAYGPDSDARIISEAYDGYENTADMVVCAPGEVSVEGYGEGAFAQIKSWANNGTFNTATTKVFASDVYVDVPTIARGRGIWASAGGREDAHVHVPLGDGDYDYSFPGSDEAVDETVKEEDNTATLIIDTYANKEDCPDCAECPDCPCEQTESIEAPVAPLPVIETPRIEGCPGLMLAVSLELGVASEPLQVAMGNALALNPSLQPCQACSSLINAASILKDPDGTRMAALSEAFNTLAQANAPMTPETEALIATAFGDAPEGSQYALAKEYIDAFVKYASVLENQLGSPTGDPLAFVMGKYGAGVTESDNNNVAAYVMSQMQGI